MASFFFASPEERHPEFARVDAWFDEQFGAAGKTHRERFIANREDSTPYTLLVDSATELTFAKPARAIAQSLAETGKASWLYRFDVESGSDDFMSPHCFDLPFLFGNRTAWSDAPMLKAVDDATYEKASLEFSLGSNGLPDRGRAKNIRRRPMERIRSLPADVECAFKYHDHEATRRNCSRRGVNDPILNEKVRKSCPNIS